MPGGLFSLEPQMATAFPVFNFQFLNPLGGMAAGYVLYQFASGTTTPQATYTDIAGTIPNANPIILDAQGQCTMYGGSSAYTFVLRTAVGGALINTWNDVQAIAVASATAFLPLSGGTMAGTLTLQADATGGLDAVTLQQLNAAQTATLASVNAALAAATTALGSSHGRLLRITPFLTSGTWTKGTDVNFIVVRGVGAGGGSTSSTNGGPGGGAGGSFEKLLTSPGATEAVTVGVGGSVAADGGSTLFGAWATGFGGKGGSGATAGGAGGIATGGDLNFTGGGGAPGGNTAANAVYGQGGNSFYGGGAPGDWNRTGGVAGAANTGGGGSGGTSNGGAGGSGSAMVYEYG